MYKYKFNDEIHSAYGFREARKRIGWFLPADIDPTCYFMVRLWLWDNEEKEYEIEILDEPGHKVFREYDDALTFFNILLTDYPEQISEDVRLELVQYHMGCLSTLHSKILFPVLLASEP